MDPEDIPRYLSCMDVYVCPSMRETYGISVVQAMAIGLPVIHYGVDGIQVGPWTLRCSLSLQTQPSHPLCCSLACYYNLSVFPALTRHYVVAATRTLEATMGWVPS